MPNINQVPDGSGAGPNGRPTRATKKLSGDALGVVGGTYRANQDWERYTQQLQPPVYTPPARGGGGGGRGGGGGAALPNAQPALNYLSQFLGTMRPQQLGPAPQVQYNPIAAWQDIQAVTVDPQLRQYQRDYSLDEALAAGLADDRRLAEQSYNDLVSYLNSNNANPYQQTAVSAGAAPDMSALLGSQGASQDGRTLAQAQAEASEQQMAGQLLLDALAGNHAAGQQSRLAEAAMQRTYNDAQLTAQGRALQAALDRQARQEQMAIDDWNANALLQAAMANAGFQNQAAMANAQGRLGVDQFNAQNLFNAAVQNAGLQQQYEFANLQNTSAYQQAQQQFVQMIAELAAQYGLTPPPLPF